MLKFYVVHEFNPLLGRFLSGRWISPLVRRQFLSAISDQGFGPNLEGFYPHRPQGFLDFCPIFIRTDLRHLAELSGVLLQSVDGVIMYL
jgi:hypothetical protein